MADWFFLLVLCVGMRLDPRQSARAGDGAVLAGYCGNSTVLDEALAEWAEAYGDQTEQDHDALVQAIKKGDLKAVQGI
jgi:hypothetical protein